MSRAFKCDRCGQCFAPTRKSNFISIREVVLGDTEYFVKRMENVDLCYKCSAEFVKWIHMTEPTVDGDSLT